MGTGADTLEGRMMVLVSLVPDKEEDMEAEGEEDEEDRLEEEEEEEVVEALS